MIEEEDSDLLARLLADIDTAVKGSGTFQTEAFIYMAYVSAAVYDAVVAIEGGYTPYGPARSGPAGASVDAAVVEAAYRTLWAYFPPSSCNPALPPAVYAFCLGARPSLDASYAEALSAIPPGQAKTDGQAVGLQAANDIIALRSGDGRMTEQTAIARFWSANVIRQYNRVGRDIADARGLGLPETARLAAMVNVVGADMGMSVLHAKYHYLFWRPVTAIDPSAVIADGFGPVPGYDDGNPATVEQTGWRPLLTTPNHPEYPAAHGVVTSAMAEVFMSFLGTNQIDLDIHGFDPGGPAGNLNAVRHFDTPNDLRHEIIDARLWAGLHYHFSGVAGVVLGRKVAKYDLRHAFQPID